MLTQTKSAPALLSPSGPSLVGTARNPIPSGAKVGTFTGIDGAELRYATWWPTAPTKLGTVCLFGGRGEFIEKYFEVVSDLRRRGFAVAIMDWRGQGGSQRMLRNPRKGHIDDFSQYDADLEQFMAEIVLPDCPAPYYGLAHSMGGNILLRSTRSRMCWYDRIILTAPLIRLAEGQSGMPGACLRAELMTLCGFGAAYIPGGSDEAWDDQPFEDNQLTSDRQRYERTQEILHNAPWLGLGSPTIGWVHASCQSMALINSPDFATSVKVPTLIIAAGNDQVVSLRAIENFASRLRLGSHVLIPGARHEIMQERNSLRDQFWAAFDAYIPGSRPSRGEQLMGL